MLIKTVGIHISIVNLNGLTRGGSFSPIQGCNYSRNFYKSPSHFGSKKMQIVLTLFGRFELYFCFLITLRTDLSSLWPKNLGKGRGPHSSQWTRGGSEGLRNYAQL